jgi:anti-anti-sigma regulatory factor
MTLKIKRIAGKRETRICLSGQLRSENVGQVKAEVRRGGAQVALDLSEVDLVDIDVVRFLNMCESVGVLILHCSPYIREWMLQERSQAKDHPEGL